MVCRAQADELHRAGSERHRLVTRHRRHQRRFPIPPLRLQRHAVGRGVGKQPHRPEVKQLRHAAEAVVIDRAVGRSAEKLQQ